MLIERCVCGRLIDTHRTAAVANAIPVAFCVCGVQVLVSSTMDAHDVANWYASGAYHDSMDRHAGVVAYADRYPSDRRAAGKRLMAHRIASGRWHEFSRALDVGCANGAFIDECLKAGIEAFGLDPDPRWHRDDGRVLDCTLATHPGGNFDLITYHDVLEHIVDPVAEVHVAASRLAPKGLLAIDVPDVSVGAGAKHYKTEHLWYFTLRSLVDVVLMAGLRFATADFPIPGKMVVYACRKL